MKATVGFGTTLRLSADGSRAVQDWAETFDDEARYRPALLQRPDFGTAHMEGRMSSEQR